MRETARYLAVGAVSLMHTIDPDIVLFGGGMIAAGQPFLENIRADIRERGLSGAGGEDVDRVCSAWRRRRVYRRGGVCAIGVSSAGVTCKHRECIMPPGRSRGLI